MISSLETAPRQRHANLQMATRALRWLLLAAAVAFVVKTMASGWPEIRSSFDAALKGNGALLAGALLVEALWTFTLAGVYRSALAAFGGRVSIGDSVRVSMGAFTLSRVLPGGGAVGGLMAGRELIRLGNPGATTLVSLLAGGWSSLLALSVTVTAGVAVGVVTGEVPPELLVGAAVALAVVAAAGIVAVVGLRRPALRRPIAKGVGRLLGKWGDVMTQTEVDVSLRILASLRLPRLAPALGWATASWALDAAALWMVLAAFGHPISIGVLFVGFGAANLLQALPELTPGWLGVLEGTMAVTFAAFGIPEATAAAAVLGYRLLSYWIPTAAGIPFGLGIMRSKGVRAPLQVAA
jgi:uncharacterized membrane protein YbhN (UPF0104 family)